MGSGGLLKMIEMRDRLDEMCRDPGASVLVGEIMLYAEGGEYSFYSPYPNVMPDFSVDRSRQIARPR